MLSFHGLQKPNRLVKRPQTTSVPENTFLTVEEIHQNRLSQFEKTLNDKQNEFNNEFAKPLPPKINFSIPLDEPIGDRMDDLISKTISARNLDILQDQPLRQQSESSSQIKYEYKHQNKPKLIKIGEEIEELPKKIISWGENTEILEDSNLFSKLKKVNTEKEIRDIKKEISVLNEKVDKILGYLENKLGDGKNEKDEKDEKIENNNIDNEIVTEDEQ